MAAREENILNVPLSETLEGMHVLCDTGNTGEPYRVAASLFIAEATQAAKDAVSNLDPKDVILKGFTALTAGKPAITANSTLLAAIQSLYAMAGSGKVKIISDGADQTGMVCWNGTSARGFVINVNEAAIYTRSQWTQSNPDSVTDANWIAAVKTGGAKNPFNALNTLLTGWVNRSTQKPTITSANTIFDALKALYWASGNGTVLNISNGENRFGFVGWNANTAYGFMVDTANFTIYIRQWAQAQATSNANTAALWREAIQDGEAFSLKQSLNGNVLHGEDITEGLEYLVPENVGDVVAFRSTMDSAQVPAEQEGFGFLAKVNGSESMAMMMQNDPAGGGKMKFFMGRVQNDGSGTEWQELTTGSSSGGLELVNTTYPITVGDGSEIELPGVTTGDHLMINLQVIKTGGVIEIWPTGSFCLHCPVVPSGGGPYKLLDIYQYEKGIEAAINIEYAAESGDAVVVVFNDYNNIDSSFAVAIHSIYKLPK